MSFTYYADLHDAISRLRFALDDRTEGDLLLQNEEYQAVLDAENGDEALALYRLAPVAQAAAGRRVDSQKVGDMEVKRSNLWRGRESLVLPGATGGSAGGVGFSVTAPQRLGEGTESEI